MSLVKIGAVMRKKDDETKYFMILGNNKSKDPKYNYTVEVIVKGADGQIITKLENPLLSLVDPRVQATEKNDERALERLNNIPNLKFEVLANKD